MKTITIWTSLCLALVGCGHAAGAAKKPGARDGASSDTETRAHASNDEDGGPSGIEVAADIRSRVADENMSISALNVRISSRDGKVSLRGSVDSEAEKQRIEEIAQDAAGGMAMESQLTVRGR
jgi:hyperosmotically inducible periplasmic protein